MNTCSVVRIFIVQDPSAVDCSGNVLLDRCVGSKIMLVPPLKYEGADGEKSLRQVVEEYAQVLR